MKYLMRNKSFIVDLFQGQYRSTVTCPQCNTVGRREEGGVAHRLEGWVMELVWMFREVEEGEGVSGT